MPGPTNGMPGPTSGRARPTIAMAAPTVATGRATIAVVRSLWPMGRAWAVPTVAVWMLASLGAQDQAPNRREVTLVARDHKFIPDRIEVTQDDLVRVTFTSEGRPASFAVDAYRILKRAGADKTIVFEFRADRAGTFPFYCSLTSDPGCRDMKGALVVRRR